MRAIATTSPGKLGEAQAKPLAGLVCGFRFHADGTPEELNVDRPGEGWLWLHFNLADARSCPFLSAASALPPPARALLVSADEHQQLHSSDFASTASSPISSVGWAASPRRLAFCTLP